ncbi:UDP-glycosyltransferase 87A2-like [Primulina tabacum]|uniref:UDP-glycosyltransferase 87A2-like n=1 Tax=Primulina tabacum TaxID=48773 RepID=UPI003F5A38F3
MDCGIVDGNPGLAPSRVADLPSIIRDQEMASAFLKSTTPRVQSKYLIKANISSSLLFTILNPKHLMLSSKSYLEWLNLQSPDWVLYSSFGSFFPVSAAQMDEIVTGLNKRGVPFLLVMMQNETNRLQEICGDNELFVEWCDQVSVLCDPRVGWFWSHCGWNSTKEAVLAAVLLLAFPIVMDQFLNANMIIEDWRIGWRVKEEFGDEYC